MKMIVLAALVVSPLLCTDARADDALPPPAPPVPKVQVPPKDPYWASRITAPRESQPAPRASGAPVARRAAPAPAAAPKARAPSPPVKRSRAAWSAPYSAPGKPAASPPVVPRRIKPPVRPAPLPTVQPAPPRVAPAAIAWSKAVDPAELAARRTARERLPGPHPKIRPAADPTWVSNITLPKPANWRHRRDPPPPPPPPRKEILDSASPHLPPPAWSNTEVRWMQARPFVPPPAPALPSESKTAPRPGRT